MRALAGRLWPWLPLVFAAAYSIALLADLRTLVQSIYQQPDFASGPYIAELQPDAPAGAEVVLTNFTWYTTLWFEQLTHGLPAHRQIWQVGPWIASLLGVGLLGWSVWRAAGGWAATMTVVVLACAGSGMLLVQVPGTGHAAAYLHVSLLGAFLVLLAGRRSGRIGGPAAHGAACAAVAAITAAGYASDTLLLVAGIVPFALAGLLLARQLAAPAGRRIAGTAVLVAVGATLGGLAIREVMEARHVVASHFEIAFAGFDALATNFRLLVHSIAYLGNGDFGGMSIDGAGLLALACAATIGAAAVAVARHARGWWNANANAAWRPAALAPGAPEARRTAHVTFWLLSVLIVVPVFVLSSLPVDRYSSRYVVTVAYGLAALTPVMAAARGPAARALVVVGACLIVGASVRGLLAHDLQDGLSRSFPTGSQSGPLLRLARSENLTYGYAGYWVAAPLSWQMKTEVQLYPVYPCPGDPARLCRWGQHQISSWYTPRPGTRTMLVVDPALPMDGPREAPAVLGRPERTVKVNRLDVYIYPYDIASRMGRD